MTIPDQNNATKEPSAYIRTAGCPVCRPPRRPLAAARAAHRDSWAGPALLPGPGPARLANEAPPGPATIPQMSFQYMAARHTVPAARVAHRVREVLGGPVLLLRMKPALHGAARAFRTV